MKADTDGCDLYPLTKISNQLEVNQVPEELLTYFRNLPGPANIGFLVAGYKKVNNISEQHVWEVIVSQNRTRRLNRLGQQGASWRGKI